MKRKNILPKMFDIKPTLPDGSLDMEKMGSSFRIIEFNQKTGLNAHRFRGESRSRRLNIQNILPEMISSERKPESMKNEVSFEIPPKGNSNRTFFSKPAEPIFEESSIKNQNTEKKKPLIFKKRFRNGDGIPSILFPIPKLKYGISFASVLIAMALFVFSFSFLQKTFEVKTSVIATGQRALGQFVEAKDNISNSHFEKAAVDFSESYEILSEANREIDMIGGNFSEILRFIPGASKLASASYVTSAGGHLALAGKSLAESAKSLDSLQNPLNAENLENQPRLTDLFLNLRGGVQTASRELALSENDLNKVNPDDLPVEVRNQFYQLKSKLPIVNENLENFLKYSQIFLDVLGYNGPRKYLFLFQNNQEMRATGGFIGSYGILDISDGRVRKLFVDDIYNPDGQLKARVIPPLPIQKMSAVWTMHDANWFPNFPTSAEKVAWFYEKTGGPTVDGVIAVTPELLRDFLEITGPIEMPEYDVTIDAENFIEKTQYEVEIDFDKEKNQPKKIISDLTPRILDRIMSERGLAPMMKILHSLNQALSEKQLLLYSRNFNVQNLISDQKWSGEILNTEGDFLSVVNSNINGFKTDGVIDEKIEHVSEIQKDGSIIDTVSITRKHNGGNEEFDWWNKVNGDWMRVYVPKDSKLLEVSGQTREFVQPALDYASLGFKQDAQVQLENDQFRLHEESGTKIYEENGKSVFANWVYVSPGESVTIKYRYILPFTLSFDDLHHPADSFSVLFQKQSGSVGSKLVSEIKIPNGMRTVWYWPDDLKANENSFRMETVLNTDRFIGMAIEK